MEHDDERDAKDLREHDAQAGVGPSADELGTHNLDLDDYDHLDDDTGDDPLKTDDESDDEGQLIAEEPKEPDAKAPFHEHPRWQEMIKERDALRQELQQAKGTMEDQAKRIDQYDAHMRMMGQFQYPQRQPEPVPEPEKDPFDEILSKGEEEIIEDFQRSPKAFLSGLRESVESKALTRLREEAAQRAQEEAIAKGIEQFAEENPDFMTMVSSGEISRFIQKNPIHNAISAFHAIQAKKGSEEQQSAREELEKQIREDERKKTLEAVRAKQGAQVLDGATSTGPQAGASTAVPPELADTAQHGGRRAVLADRLRRLRERW